MSVCQACGGVIGRDCWNPRECAEITDQMGQEDWQARAQAAEALVSDLLEALKAAELFIYNRSGGGETEFRETFLLPAISKAEAA